MDKKESPCSGCKTGDIGSCYSSCAQWLSWYAQRWSEMQEIYRRAGYGKKSEAGELSGDSADPV